MKKFIKKTACALIFSFFTVFVFSPAYADHRFNGKEISEKWGRGGKWETKDSSASNAMWPIVAGILGIGVLIWLFKKGPGFNEPKIIYIEKKTVSPEKEQGEQGSPLKYNTTYRNAVVEENEDTENIAIESYKNREEQGTPTSKDDGHTNEIF